MYKNYGDKDFFQYGRLVEKESETEYRIIVCDPYSDQEDCFQFAETLVDITDSWIDRQAVMNYGGMTEDNFDAIRFAIDCIEYYGAHEFGAVNYSYDWMHMTRKQIEHILMHIPIELE